jgi:hypothetical protein
MQQQAEGIRSDLRPSVKKLLNEVGNEEIKKLVVYRDPLPYSKFIKKLRPDIPYDDMFHLALNINGKYDLYKDGITVSFERASPKADQREVKVPNNMTIQELFNKTEQRMGKKDFLEYDIETLNCQNFVDNILSAIGSNSSDLKNFINQDVKQVVNKLGGKYLKAFLNIFKKASEILDIAKQGGGQTGEGCCCDNTSALICINNGNRLCKILT